MGNLTGEISELIDGHTVDEVIHTLVWLLADCVAYGTGYEFNEHNYATLTNMVQHAYVLCCIERDDYEH